MNNIKTFPANERKLLMQRLFPLKTDERFTDLYADMTLTGYTAKIRTLARHWLDSGSLATGSDLYLRVADVAWSDISAEAAQLYAAWKQAT